MITELYSIDSELVNNLIENEVTFDIYESTGQGGSNAWRLYFRLSPSQIVSESLEIKQSICDTKELHIGGCIPSQLTLSVMDLVDSNGNPIDLSGKRIVVNVRTKYFSSELYPDTSLYPDTNLYFNTEPQDTAWYTLFVGQIYSYKKTNNYKIRKITAYDRLYYASTVMCRNRFSAELDTIYQSHLNCYISHVVTWLFPIARITQPGSSNFINYNEKFNADSVDFLKCVDKKVTYLDLVQDLCELNAVFIVEDNPTSPESSKASARYIKLFNNVSDFYTIDTYANTLKYDDFCTAEIRKMSFYYQNSNGLITKEKSGYSPDYGNYIFDNRLLNSLFSNDDVKPFIKNLDGTNDNIDKIMGSVYVYRPFKASVFNRWWVQVGDRVKLPTSDPQVPFVESIVLSRTIKGIINMKVEIEAKGVQILGKESDDQI